MVSEHKYPPELVDYARDRGVSVEEIDILIDVINLRMKYTSKTNKGLKELDINQENKDPITALWDIIDKLKKKDAYDRTRLSVEIAGSRRGRFLVVLSTPID